MQEFDAVWAEPTIQKFGLEGSALHNFCVSMLQDQGFRAEKHEKLLKLFDAKLLNDSSVIQGQDALNFI